MKLYSHRGFWHDKLDNNTRSAFERSFKHNFGIETDIRDFNGELVISHDIPTGSQFISFSEFLDMHTAGPHNSPLALNIKSDGLHEKLRTALESYRVMDYFVFDMSVPDMLSYISAGMNVYGRISEYELNLHESFCLSGVWLDCFNSMWYNSEYIEGLLLKYDNVCIVSEELHGRDNTKQWLLLQESGIYKKDGISLCTDYPSQAKTYFDL
jgi:hypothetical protein